ncbi:hypothetical protein F5883DRAFT_536378 [Diaporthe sp. PMI_573]|jgi:hypothetical protein|nr:hypothetical protein F5883DRAFT_536378 [Diaporthaceae sp. PMI_573]
MIIIPRAVSPVGSCLCFLISNRLPKATFDTKLGWRIRIHREAFVSIRADVYRTRTLQAAVDETCQAESLFLPHLSCLTPGFPRVGPALTKSGVTLWGPDRAQQWLRLRRLLWCRDLPTLWCEMRDHTHQLCRVLCVRKPSRPTILRCRIFTKKPSAALADLGISGLSMPRSRPPASSWLERLRLRSMPLRPFACPPNHHSPALVEFHLPEPLGSMRAHR